MKNKKGRDLAAKEIAEADIAAVMKQYPALTAFGFGCFGQYHRTDGSNCTEEMKRGQETLLGSVNQCRVACDWLRGVEKSKAVNKRHSSYGLKHQLERLHSPFYCSNGALITAAIHLGFRWVQVGPNAYFNFKQASVNKLYGE